MSVRLGAVSPNRPRLRAKAAFCFLLSLLPILPLTRLISQNMPAEPLSWFLRLGFYLALALLFFFRGVYHLARLYRVLEFYEDAIVYENRMIPLSHITLVSWEVHRRFPTGIFCPPQRVCRIHYSPAPLPHFLTTSTHLLTPDARRFLLPDPSIRVASFWESDFPGILSAFDDAYLHSIPERFYTK